MCGITGFIDPGRRVRDAEDVLHRMTRALAHRGPDDEGTFVGAGAYIGHRRLSIIDLNGGHQPQFNEDEQVVVVQNGEIYNFEELKAGLEARGHRFRTRSDTEVLAHLWEEKGRHLVDDLVGMFAIAVWDRRSRTLFLARDRMGQKPLYYRASEAGISFGSELRSVMAHPDTPRQVSLPALRKYLVHDAVPCPDTILEGVHKLEPGSWLTWQDGRVAQGRYWDLSFPDPATLPSDENALQELLWERLRESTRLRLLSDVPLGVFLSGGIDSSTVVALMAELLPPDRIKTFAIGFDEAQFNESHYAQIAADRFKTDHQEFFVRPDALEILPLLAHHYDEPFADPSSIPTYYVSKVTREHVTVALTGDAGDEGFAGYRRYRGVQIARWVDNTPILRNVMKLDWGRLVPSANLQTSAGRLKRLLTSFSIPPLERYFRQMNWIDMQQMRDLLHPEFASRVDREHPRRWFCGLQDAPGRDIAAAAMDRDFEAYLPCDILAKVDIASMAVSLECRSPFLDHHVVELACRMPTEWRIRGFTHKYILKKALADLIPPQIARRPKMGFGVPLVAWFRGPLTDVLRESLLSKDALARNYFKPEVVRQLIEDHVAHRRDNTLPLWQLLMLEQWHRRWAP